MRRNDASQPHPAPVIRWWWALAGVLAAAAFSAVTTIILLGIARHDPTLRIEAIKTGLTVGAGTGGAAALLLAFRRQWLNEHIARDTTYDATERRVTDLYAKAVEQLGHDKAAVRLGGLYSLERLAQDHPQHRQTVTDVICAYLRMPYQPPTAPTTTQPPHPGTSPPPSDDTRQELQVRLAAQRIFIRHLATPPDTSINSKLATPTDTYWHNIRIDLTGATLTNPDFTYCHLQHADFTNAQFSGDAVFTEAQFSGDAGFARAVFSRTLSFEQTQVKDLTGKHAWPTGWYIEPFPPNPSLGILVQTITPNS